MIEYNVSRPSDQPISGVYMMLCVSTGGYYIGISDDVNRRYKEHLYALKFGQYADGKQDAGKQKMQADHDHYGRHTFCHSVICWRSNMALVKELEKHLIKRFQPEYNSVHRDKEAEQKPFNMKAVELFLSSWLPIPLREMPKNKAFNFAATWKRLKEIHALEKSIATQTGLRQMLNDFYPDMFTLSKGSITRIKDYE